MKAFVLIVLALAGVQLCSAEDDGQYRPYLYGTDDGRYRSSEYGRYYQSRFSNFGSNGKYASLVSNYQPVVVASPYGAYGFRDLNGFELVPLASSVYASRVKPYSLPVIQRYYSKSGAARILKQDQDQDEKGYHYLYQTENGINAEEYGKVDQGLSGGTNARGFYEYTGDDGLKYRVDYVADDNGFQPSGAHLPK